MTTLFRMTLPALLAVAFAVPLGAQNGPSAQGIVFIDSQRILAEAPAANAARETFQQEMQGFQSELAPMEENLQQMMEDYQQQQSVLQPDTRRQREQEIRQRQQEYQQRRAQLQQQADQRMQELLAPVMESINRVIQTLREERGYAMIFDAAQGALIDADPSLDITQEVLSRLQGPASPPQP